MKQAVTNHEIFKVGVFMETEIDFCNGFNMFKKPLIIVADTQCDGLRTSIIQR